MVQGFYQQNFDTNKLQQVKSFAQGTKQQVEKADTTLGFAAAESIPMFRRVSSLPEKLRNDDYVPAAGLAGLALINLPEDLRDVKAAGRQIRGMVDKNYKYDPLYNRNTHQHSFSFFRGTMIEKWIHEQKKKGNKLAKVLWHGDKTVYKSKFGAWVKDVVGAKLDNSNGDALVRTKINKIDGSAAKAAKFKGSAFGRMTCRAMKRIPLLSVAALALLEIPKIFKATNEGGIEKGAKQTVKSAVNVPTVLAGIGYGGAIGAKYGGAFGSLVGMGLGAIAGGKTSQKIQELID